LLPELAFQAGFRQWQANELLLFEQEKEDTPGSGDAEPRRSGRQFPNN
jgi:hypothetical protein